uniref:ribosomal protein S3 n=1 Tax=Thalassionema frauenfeldii TaxID=186022 RepID=UPI001EDCBCD8|nr:ribosomal protein S3 [Thalassionema frauenfeldii]UHY40555.1 ribosomal protein S3 [Thalassionema frauenfeldii]UHY40943.1 ribosomal protein S3 [Thalassionema frauenfeldii]
MGQKTHPLGFRLGITQEHKSIWFSNFNQYANILKEDDKIRTYLNTVAKRNSISNVRISRNGLNDQIQLDIETGKPGILVGKLGVELRSLLDNIKKLLPVDRKLTITVLEVEKIDLNAGLLGDLVVEQLEKRIAFRRAIREALQRAQKQNVQGIKIQVSGRLNGAEIARSEWIREGRVPLQTLRANIDYATREANTIYGVLGIKVWLFKNEILKT